MLLIVAIKLKIPQYEGKEDPMKIYVSHRTYEKLGNKWALCEDFGTKEITRKEYDLLANEKWKGDKRTYGYTPLGYNVEKLVNIEPTHKQMKSVREFTFEY